MWSLKTVSTGSFPGASLNGCRRSYTDGLGRYARGGGSRFDWRGRRKLAALFEDVRNPVESVLVQRHVGLDCRRAREGGACLLQLARLFVGEAEMVMNVRPTRRQ